MVGVGGITGTRPALGCQPRSSGSGSGEPLRGVRLPPLLRTAPTAVPQPALCCPCLCQAPPQAAAAGSAEPAGGPRLSCSGCRQLWAQLSVHKPFTTSFLPLLSPAPAPPPDSTGAGPGPWYLLAGRHSEWVTQGAAVPTRGVESTKGTKAYPSSLLRLSGDRC